MAKKKSGPSAGAKRKRNSADAEPQGAPIIRRGRAIVTEANPGYRDDGGIYPTESASHKSFRLEISPYDLTPLSDDERRRFIELVQGPSTEPTPKDEATRRIDAQISEERRQHWEKRLEKQRGRDTLVLKRLDTGRRTRKLENASKVIKQKIAEAMVVLRAWSQGPSSQRNLSVSSTFLYIEDLQMRTASQNEDAADDARRALDRFLKLIRRFIAKEGVLEAPEVWSMIDTAFLVGQTRERAFIRVHPMVVKHQRIKAGGKTGADKKKEKAAAKSRNMQAAIDEYMKNGAKDGLSYTKAMEKVAADFDASVSTVGKNTKNNWPRAGGRKSTK